MLLFIYLFIYLFIFLIFNFILFWLCWVFIAVCGLSLVVASRGYSSLLCAGFSLRWLLLLQSRGSRCMGFSSCSTRAQQLRHVRPRVHRLQQLRIVGSVVVVCGIQGMQASVVVVHGLSSFGLQALEHRLSSCGAWVQLLRGTWDLLGPRIEPMSPAWSSGFLTTEVPPISFRCTQYCNKKYPEITHRPRVFYMTVGKRESLFWHKYHIFCVNYHLPYFILNFAFCDSCKATSEIKYIFIFRNYGNQK